MNLTPFRSVHLPSFWLNISMTVPLGFFLASRTRSHRLLRVAAAAFAVSVSIELLQLVLAVTLGADRATDIDDVLTNTGGAVLGALLCRVISRKEPRWLS